MEFEGLCDDGSVAEPPAGSNCSSPANSWRAVYDSISSSCVACHSSGAASGGLGGFEDAVSSYNALVGVTSGQSPSDLVEPGDSSLSYLVNKLEGTGSGQQMPSGGTLTAAQIQAVSDWIDSGASLN
jgi:mono/diheme cytochrome c family protein